MNKALKKILVRIGAAAAGAAAVAGAASYATTKLLINTALDRDEPKSMKRSGGRISGNNNVDADFENTCSAAARRLQEQEHEYVKIVGGDGVNLVGHFYPCKNAKRVIIAFHGWRSSWYNDYGLISDFWHESGSSVLYVEQRGQNNSGGEYMGFGLTERYDCISWINWVICRCGKNVPIYLAGLSMGATTVLMASDLDLPPEVHGIMADCGFTSPRAIWKHVAEKNLHIVYGIHSGFIDAMCRQKIRMGSGEHSTVDALKKTDIPVLFVHGTDDHFVPVEMTYENYKACNAPKRLLIVPGADHAMSYYINKEEYERVVRGFWQEFDNAQREAADETTE